MCRRSYDLDVVDQLEATSILGGPADDPNLVRKKKKKHHEKLRDGSHTDAVISLCWNSAYRFAGSRQSEISFILTFSLVFRTFRAVVVVV
jgi:hypothetical protein